MKPLILISLVLLPLSAAATPPSSARAAAAGSRSASTPLPMQPALPTEESKALRAELAAAKESKAAADQALDVAKTELRRLNTELLTIRQASANVLQIQSERDNLQENVIHLERELEAVKRARQAAEEDQRQSWFLIGAGVLLGGLMLGLVLPQLSWRKRNGWDSF